MTQDIVIKRVEITSSNGLFFLNSSESLEVTLGSGLWGGDSRTVKQKPNQTTMRVMHHNRFSSESSFQLIDARLSLLFFLRKICKSVARKAIDVPLQLAS